MSKAKRDDPNARHFIITLVLTERYRYQESCLSNKLQRVFNYSDRSLIPGQEIRRRWGFDSSIFLLFILTNQKLVECIRFRKQNINQSKTGNEGLKSSVELGSCPGAASITIDYLDCQSECVKVPMPAHKSFAFNGVHFRG